MSGDFRIALPPGALVSSFAVERAGSRQTAQIALAARAKQELRSAGGVLEWAGDGWLRGTLPSIAAGEELKVEVQYAEWLSPRKHGDGQLVQYRYPLVGDGEAPLIGDFVARIDASAVGAHGRGGGLRRDERGRHRHRAPLGLSPVRGSGGRRRDAVALKTARGCTSPRPRTIRKRARPSCCAPSCRPPTLNDGVTLAIVVDTSGSIEPALLDAERALVEALLAGLGARDRAVVLSADQSSRARSVPTELGPVDAARRKAISAALGKLSPGGATDLGRALEAAADAPARRRARRHGRLRGRRLGDARRLAAPKPSPRGCRGAKQGAPRSRRDRGRAARQSTACCRR